VLTGVKMWWAAGKEPDLSDNPALKPAAPLDAGQQAVRRRALLDGRERQADRHATADGHQPGGADRRDLRSGLDPAIFAITSDPFIVLTSNVFAILGLRAMYFLLAAVANKFHLLNYGLAVILVFIGTKMCLIDIYKIPVGLSLGVVVGILALTMLLSVRTANMPCANADVTNCVGSNHFGCLISIG
jgi:tellurite resistance protein TerC